ncbi:hypothetical protein TSUD_183560 [Trifolium subterraneum]|uniref:Uncharacterized protein n=1 Tax=Trifolium subterraneum TaxID=3900 RepID=A0A2Z6N466_TRISU|nr:hypothetical protein TSUD_183560 [Trifolium subterraneum]
MESESNLKQKQKLEHVVCKGVKDVFGMEFCVEYEFCNVNIGGKGCHRKGLFLMLIFFAWGQILRFSCYYIGGYKQGNGTFIQVGLFCMVIPLKWVIFMIYFNYCKERHLVKKIDEELDKDVRVGLFGLT